MPTPSLRAVHPCAIEYDGRRMRVGCLACALLACVIASGGRAKLAEVQACVWGEEEAPRGRLDSMCHRLNRQLERIGCPARLAVDGSVILLV